MYFLFRRDLIIRDILKETLVYTLDSEDITIKIATLSKFDTFDVCPSYYITLPSTVCILSKLIKYLQKNSTQLHAIGTHYLFI